MANLEEKVAAHAEHLATLRAKQEAHEERIAGLEIITNELRAYFGKAATRDDVHGLQKEMHQALNGILKDALAAVPQKVTLWFTGITVLLSLIATLIAFFK